MTNQNSDMTKYLSKCCHREVIEQHGCDADFGHGKKECDCEIVTTWYECFACKKPCDAYGITVTTSTPEQPIFFETATPEQKKELIRECVREANQDQRDIVKRATDIEKLIELLVQAFSCTGPLAESTVRIIAKPLVEQIFKAGARAHAKAIKPVICRGGATEKASDQFFNNLNI